LLDTLPMTGGQGVASSNLASPTLFGLVGGILSTIVDTPAAPLQ
jgi:hypothetical protein